MKAKYWWLKERHNPQIKNPTYSAYGKITVKEALRHGNAIYGTNIMHKFETEAEYLNKIEQLKSTGARFS